MVDQQKIMDILKASGSDAEPSTEDFDRSFSEIGLDSLDVYNFLSEIEVSLGKKVSDEEFQNLNTLNDVINFVNA